MVLDYTIQSIINKFTCLLYTLALYKSSMFFTEKNCSFYTIHDDIEYLPKSKG